MRPLCSPAKSSKSMCILVVAAQLCRDVSPSTTHVAISIRPDAISSRLASAAQPMHCRPTKVSRVTQELQVFVSSNRCQNTSNPGVGPSGHSTNLQRFLCIYAYTHTNPSSLRKKQDPSNRQYRHSHDMPEHFTLLALISAKPCSVLQSTELQGSAVPVLPLLLSLAGKSSAQLKYGGMRYAARRQLGKRASSRV
jgi:hypothetical protein